MGCGITLAKVILVLINIFVALFSLIALALGIALAVAGDIIRQYGAPLLANFAQTIATQVGADGEAVAQQILAVLTGPDLNLLGILKNIAIPLIIVGAILFVISILGCVGACCNVKCALLLYSLITTLIAVGVLVACLVVYLNQEKYMRDFADVIGELVRTKFVNETSLDPVSLIMNLLQIQLNCCGFRNGTDYEGATNTNYSFVGQVIPFTCCINGVDDYDKSKNGDLLAKQRLQECVTTMRKEPSRTYYFTGCFGEIKDSVVTYSNYAILGVAIAMGVLVLLCILGWVLFANVVNNNKIGV